MGLDMYLSRKKFIGANYEHRKITGSIDIKQNGKEIPIDFNKVSYIEEAVGYWRKANAIHKWFVDKCQDGVDDCKEYYVSSENLEDLLNTCKEIKEKVIMKKGKVANGQRLTEDGWVDILEDGEYISNPEICEELLPTEDGCFFGSTAYDEYYMNDIDYTIKLLEELLEEDKKLNEQDVWCDYYYQSSW